MNSNEILDSLFETSNECKDNACKIDKRDVLNIYKPDLGLKDFQVKKSLFASLEPKLCDCIIVNSNKKILLMEIKCGTVTNRLLKEIIEQLTNVYKILESKKINIHKCVFICKKFSDTMVKKRLLKEKIKAIPLTHKIFQKTAIKI